MIVCICFVFDSCGICMFPAAAYVYMTLYYTSMSEFRKLYTWRIILVSLCIPCCKTRKPLEYEQRPWNLTKLVANAENSRLSCPFLIVSDVWRRSPAQASSNNVIEGARRRHHKTGQCCNHDQAKLDLRHYLSFPCSLSLSPSLDLVSLMLKERMSFPSTKRKDSKKMKWFCSIYIGILRETFVHV